MSKRNRGAGEDENAGKKRKYSSGGRERDARMAAKNPVTLSVEDQAIRDQLKSVNINHSYWGWFNSDQRISLNPLGFDQLNQQTLDGLIKTYKKAEAEKKQADAIKKANDEVIKKAKEKRSQPGKTSEDDFIIAFMNIGSGDCIFFRTPGQRVFVVDCGKRASPTGVDSKNETQVAAYRKAIRNILSSSAFLGGENKELHFLILTHPDLDHYNEIENIVKPCISKVEHAFFTTEKGGYSENSTFDFLDKADILNRIYINSDGVNIESSAGADWTDLYTASPYSVRILEEANCTVDLLAGQVAPGSSKETATNAASMVTLIEVHRRKVLLCGDATHGTEAFLTANHKARIKDVDMMQLEHHGSGTEHAGDDFVKLVNPMLAVVSSGPHEGDFNPRWTTIEKYVDAKRLTGKPHRLCQGLDKHDIRYGGEGDWMPMGGGTWQTTYSTHALYTTDINGHLYFTISKDKKISRTVKEEEVLVTYKIGIDGKVERS